MHWIALTLRRKWHLRGTYILKIVPGKHASGLPRGLLVGAAIDTQHVTIIIFIFILIFFGLKLLFFKK